MIELAGIVIFGMIAQWVAWKFKIPAILPLILIGLFVGPISTLLSEDGTKWIEPIWNGTEGLFPNEGLFHFVSLSISIILFEGGLTLKKEEILNVGPAIVKLITLGSVVTFLGAGLAAHYIFDLTWDISFLFASLIIVTGPTVISPILRNLPLKKEVSTVLKWEGILIDPIGALVAVLVYEFILAGLQVGQQNDYTIQALIVFGKIVVVGFTIGFAAAYGLYYAIKYKLIPHYLLNVLSLALVLMVFVVSDIFAHESGLLSVVVMGMVLGNKKVAELKEILYFKESLSILLISILFILLSANINLEDLQLLMTWKTLGLFSFIVFILRPIAVFLSTGQSGLKTNEKLFISWVGPRGIVAAGIASLFGLKLADLNIEGAEFITPLVFMVVMGTVLLNATTARIIAKTLGVFLNKSEGILIIGASQLSQVIASYLQSEGRRVVLMDSNSAHVEQAKERGLEALEDNIYSGNITENIELNDIGFLISLTSSDQVNAYAMEKYVDYFGERGTYRLLSEEELKSEKMEEDEILFSTNHDYLTLSEICRDYPEMHSIPVNSMEEFEKATNKMTPDTKSIALFVKDKKSDIIQVIQKDTSKLKIENGNQLIYLGKEIPAN